MPASTQDEVRIYELNSLLFELSCNGFIVIQDKKLLRLLGRETMCAGTWRALTEAWERFDRKDNELYIIGPTWQGMCVLSKTKSESVAARAGS